MVLRLPLDQAGDALCVKHLNEEVLKLTDIPVEFQKLIYKGEFIVDFLIFSSADGMSNTSLVFGVNRYKTPAV